MTLQHIIDIINADSTELFYASAVWLKLRSEVMKYDHYECQLCKQQGRYRRGVLVHHIKHLRDRPDLALSIYDPETGERQLITVCKQCHEEQHPEALQPKTLKKCEQITPERWD